MQPSWDWYRKEESTGGKQKLLNINRDLAEIETDNRLPPDDIVSANKRAQEFNVTIRGYGSND